MPWNSVFVEITGSVRTTRNAERGRERSAKSLEQLWSADCKRDLGKSEEQPWPWLSPCRLPVAHMRRLKIESVAQTIADGLDSPQVTIEGYAVAAKTERGLATELLVMPTAAMCSHVSAPSALHVVAVQTDEGVRLARSGTPVRISGALAAKMKSTPLFAATGVQDVTSAYRLVPTKIEVVSRTK